MKFTKATLALSLAAVAGFACAESQVTLYGSVDTAVIVGKAKGEATTVGIDDGVSGGSLWGIMGTEDLGNGLEVGFQLENEFASDTGSTGILGKAFSKISTLHISGDFGLLAFGLTGGLASGEGEYSIWEPSPFFNDYAQAGLPNVFVTGQFMKNSIVYESPDIEGFQLHLMYSNSGEEDSDDAKFSLNNHYYGVGLSYEVGDLNLALVVEGFTFGNYKADMGDSFKSSMVYSLSASYDFEVAKLFFGYQYASGIHSFDQVEDALISGKGARQHAFTLGTEVPLAGGTLKAAANYGFGKLKGQWTDGEETADFNKDKYSRLSLGVGYEYPLSKRTFVYGFGAWQKGFKEFSDAADFNDWSVGLGLHHDF